jgi:hypothetical protein
MIAMLERVSVGPLGLATAAAAASASGSHPTIWWALGYPFEAASLIAALFAAIVTRVIVSLRARSVAYALDGAVLVLVLITTTAVVIGWHPSLVGGLLYGLGLGIIGEGILRVAQQYTDRGFAALGIDMDDDDHAAMNKSMEQMYRLPPVPLQLASPEPQDTPPAPGA